jgi:DNA processing protein
MDVLGWQTLLAAEMPTGKSLALLRELGSFSGNVAETIQKHPLLTAKERERAATLFPEKVKRALESGVEVVVRKDFPEGMQAVEYPPALFAWGDFGVTHAPCIGIVGTRGATTYGKAVAMKFAESFARAGVTVISGGALGIDAAAHKGTLSAGGKTVAVLAGGIEQIYPAVHGGLFQQIRANGCLVSQHAIGSRPNAYKFLHRNQLIAGLSMAVVVVEAPERSGALSTVHAANEQGKQVFVVPANIDNSNFKGSHALIRDGATLVDHPDQVLDALGILSLAAPQVKVELSDLAKRIVSALAEGPLTAEFIVDRTGLDTSEAMAELTMLEIDGVVIRDGGQYSVRP